jgi:hypothetical protein
MKVKCDTMLTMMKTLMTVDFFEGNEPLFPPNVLRPEDIVDQEVRVCRMDLPGPTSSVGTRTDYSVGP